MADTVSEDRVERPGWAKPTVSDFFDKWHIFWADYKKVLDAVENRRLTRQEAYDIVQRRSFLVEEHPMVPAKSIDYAGALRDGLFLSIDDAVDESYLKPVDIREQTRRYVAQCVPVRQGFVRACYTALKESAICRAIVGAACGAAASAATIPFVPDYVFDKTPSYIVAAAMLGAVIGAIAGKPVKRND